MTCSSSRCRRRRRVACLWQHAVRPAEEVLRRAGVGEHHRLGGRAGAAYRPGDADARRSFAIRTCRPTSIASCARSRPRWGRGETFNKTPVGVYFGSPGVEADDPYFGGVGPRRTGCISCGKCNIGCGHNAKNKLTTNYLYLAERIGAEIHELHEVFDVGPLDGGGFEVHVRHPGWAQRAEHLDHHVYTAEQVIVSAHAYGSSKLLLRMQHEGRLAGLSSELGQRARTNSEQLLAITRTHGEWSRDPAKISLTPGSVSITSGVWPDPETSIEPVYWGVGNDLFAFLVTYHEHGEQKHPTASWVKELIEHPSEVLELRRPPRLGRADGDHALLADDRHVDRAVLARRSAAQPTHRHAALRCTSRSSSSSSTG